MKRILLIGFLLLSVGQAAGQSQNVDSLVHVLETKPMSYEEKRELYLKICENFLYFDLPKTFDYASQALSLAKKEGDVVQQSLFTEFQGRVYAFQSKHDSAVIFFNRALELAQKSANKEREACVYLSLAVTYRLQSSFDQSLEHCLKALQLHEELDDKVNILVDLGNIADIYISLNDYSHALTHLKKAEQVIEASPDLDNPVGILNVYYQLTSVYSHIDDPDKKSAEYALKTLELADRYGHTQFKIAALNALSTHAANDKHYEKALAYGKEALQLSESFGHRQLIVGMWASMSQLYRKMERWDASESAALKVLELDTTDVHNNKTALYNVVYSNIYLGDKERASDFLHKYETYWKTSSEKSLHNSLADMEVKYETEKKEMRICSLEKERRLYIWLGIAGGLLAVALGIVLWQKIKSTQREKQLIAARSVLDGEMKERSRLARDLHDRLSGNLSAVKIGLNDPGESQQNISDKLDSCIEEVRRVAHNLMPASLQFGLKVALEDFTAQFPNVRFHFFGEESRIDERKAFVIYCCATELVNNSLRHSDAKNINLQLIQSEKQVTLTVQDDGCGFDEKSVVKGLGLKNMTDRVTSCGGRIDTVTSPGKGTETTIELKT